MSPRFIIQDSGTIRETRDEAESRPRKRQRTDSGIDTGGYSETDCVALADGPVEDDPEFYRMDADANCVVHVANTRFKIKGSLLADSSPVLQDIIARHLADTHRAHGPLILIADAAEFRALLSALYASPQELEAQAREHESVDRLLLIALISRQYRCSNLHAWAMSALMNIVSNDAAFVASCSSATFTRLLDVAVRTRNDALLDTTVAQWATRLRTLDAPSVPAILAADAHELPRLRGVAYYAHIQRMVAQQTTVTARGATQFQADPKLSNAQVVRLLSGYWSLVSLWERLRRAPPKLACAEACGKTCARVWAERWAIAAGSDRMHALGSVSVLALLAAMRDQLAADQELKEKVAPQCRIAALEAVKMTASEVEDGLADHFFGWL